MWVKIKAKVASSIVNVFAKQTNYEIKNTTLILGSTRSGTTFLMESLNRKNDFRIIFEPFNATYSKEWSSFGSRHFIDPNHPDEKASKAVDDILRGKIKNRWVDQYNRKFRSEKRIIKAVRANLLLDYLEKQCPELRILYLYRHPKKVVLSRMKLNFDPRDVWSILEHKVFLDRYYSDINIELLKRKLDTPVKCHTALWCLENRFILQSKDRRKIDVLEYESIVDSTLSLENEALKVTPHKRRPSVTSAIVNSNDLSMEEMEDLDGILHIFNVHQYLTSND